MYTFLGLYDANLQGIDEPWRSALSSLTHSSSIRSTPTAVSAVVQQQLPGHSPSLFLYLVGERLSFLGRYGGYGQIGVHVSGPASSEEPRQGSR